MFLLRSNHDNENIMKIGQKMLSYIQPKNIFMLVNLSKNISKLKKQKQLPIHISKCIINRTHLATTYCVDPSYNVQNSKFKLTKKNCVFSILILE